MVAIVLSEDTVKQLVSMPCFISNVSKLAYMLHQANLDASQELLLELLDHRLHKWTDKDVTLAIQRDLPSLKWRIKYARKDIVRKEAKLNSQEREKAQMVAHMEPHVSNEAETLESLGRLRELFKNANTRDWAESVLRVGQRETMVRFNQSPRQFNSKLNKVCKYARQWQPKQSNSHTKELKLLKEWDSIMANETTDDNDIQDFINSHQDYINEIVDSPLIRYQGKVLKDFEHASKDKYVFANLMAKREQQLKESK